jgi:hypothetical protein
MVGFLGGRVMNIISKHIGIVLALAVAAPTSALADERRILDLLLKKHVITQEEYDEFLKEATETPTPPVKAEATPSAEDAGRKAVETQKEANKQKGIADKEVVKEGEEKGFLAALKEGFMPSESEYDKAPYTPMLLRLHRQERFGVHLHNVEARYAYQPDVSTSSGATHGQFQLATAELEASGYVFPGLLFAQVVIEPRDNLGRGLGDSIAKNIPPGNNAPSGILRDAFFDLVVAEPATIRLGQQRIPFGIEAQTPGGLLPFTSRSYIDLKLTKNPGLDNTKYSNAEFIQERDIGLQARGRLSEGRFDYAVGVFNGAGINVNDTNNSKDFVGRLGFNPHPGLRFGISGYQGTQVDIQKVSADRNRVGLDFEVTQDLLPRIRFMGEVANGHDSPFTRRSWYLAGFYELMPQLTPRAPGLLLGLRYDEMRENVDDVGGVGDVYRRWTVGLNYYFLNAVNRTSGYWQQVKFQLEYEFRKHNASSQSFASTDVFGHNLLMGQMTLRY